MPRSWEIHRIEGMCVTKGVLHYHAALDDKAREWYLDNSWSISTKSCHAFDKKVGSGNPYADWLNPSQLSCDLSEQYPNVKLTLIKVLSSDTWLDIMIIYTDELFQVYEMSRYES